MNQHFQIAPFGDCACTVTFGHTIDPQTNNRALALSSWLDAHPFPGMEETVTGYASVTVYYRPAAVFARFPHASPARTVRTFISQAVSESSSPAPAIRRVGRLVRIPVCYGAEFGPDLAEVAGLHGLSEEETIRMHAQPEYRVYMIGFSPGFPYLGGLPEMLATPRKNTPRLSVPGGSVGIAADQTGIYPFASPGGWQIIGRTPLLLFDVKKTPPNLLRPGDRILFVPITSEAFRRERGKANK